jgi:hypothetical protein
MFLGEGKMTPFIELRRGKIQDKFNSQEGT